MLLLCWVSKYRTAQRVASRSLHVSEHSTLRVASRTQVVDTRRAQFARRHQALWEGARLRRSQYRADGCPPFSCQGPQETVANYTERSRSISGILPTPGCFRWCVCGGEHMGEQQQAGFWRSCVSHVSDTRNLLGGPCWRRLDASFWICWRETSCHRAWSAQERRREASGPRSISQGSRDEGASCVPGLPPSPGHAAPD